MSSLVSMIMNNDKFQVLEKDNLFMMAGFAGVAAYSVNNIVWAHRKLSTFADEKVMMTLLNGAKVVLACLLVLCLLGGDKIFSHFFRNSDSRSLNFKVMAVLFLLLALAMVLYGIMYNYSLDADGSTNVQGDADDLVNKQHLKVSLIIKLVAFAGFALTVLPRVLGSGQLFSGNNGLESGLMCGNYLWIFALLVVGMSVVSLARLLKNNEIPTKALGLLAKSVAVFGLYAIVLAFVNFKCRHA